MASIVIHGLLIVSWQGGTIAGGHAAALLTALEGTDPIEVIRLRDDQPAAAAAAAPEASENARPVLRVELPEMPMMEPMVTRLAPTLVRAPESGRGLDGLLPSSGAGEADGAGDGEGTGTNVLVLARARSILRTWRPPPMVIGSEVMVRVHTDETGIPTGPVELVDPTSHEETNREIIYRARSLEYWPARLNGEAVASWAEISFEFCHHGTTAASPPSPGYGMGEPCAPEVQDLSIVVAAAKGIER